MIKVLKYCFDNWWKPILFLLASWIFVLLADSFKLDSLSYISYSFLGLSVVGLFCSTIYQLVKKRWMKGIFTFSFIIGSFLAFLLYAISSYFINTIDGDKWADNLIIPNDIELFIPNGDLLSTPNDSLFNIKKDTLDFELYNSFQPGLYEYVVWIDRIQKGTVYLKAFEITQEYQLSEKTLLKRSSIKVNNPTDAILNFRLNDHFTIYEGDWGKPYAARFEVWFKPDDKTPERKLAEKIYKIEGWMR
ncbi:hypothetical protein GYB57_14895 [bacterium]|nr:hypothetical protein [bacterium]